MRCTPSCKRTWEQLRRTPSRPSPSSWGSQVQLTQNYSTHSSSTHTYSLSFWCRELCSRLQVFLGKPGAEDLYLLSQIMGQGVVVPAAGRVLLGCALAV